MQISRIVPWVFLFVFATGDVFAEENPQLFLSNLTEEVSTKVAASALNDEDRSRSFREILRRSFVMPEISQMVLGRHWRAATPAQQGEFTQLFEDLLVVTWSRRFKDCDCGKIVIGDPISMPDGDVLLGSRIDRPGREALQLEWRLRGGSDGYRVLDIKVEGVSMLLSHRSEYQSILQNGGVARLLSLLRQKVQGSSVAG